MCYCIALRASAPAKGAGEVLRALLPTAMEMKFQLRLLWKRNQVLSYGASELLPLGYVMLCLPIGEVLRPSGMFSSGT